MRTHRDIVKSHGALKLARALVALGVDVHQTTPQRWADRDSIPGEYWNAIVSIGVATLDELAEAADETLRKRLAEGTAADVPQ